MIKIRKENRYMESKQKYCYWGTDWRALERRNKESDNFDVNQLMKNKKDVLTEADCIYLHTTIYMKLDNMERIKELCLVGEEYTKVAIRKNIRTRLGKRLADDFARYLQYYFLHYFRSVNANRADEEPLAIAYEHIQVVAENKIQKKLPQKKMYGMMAIYIAIMLGDFEKAGYYLSCIYKRKKTQKLEKEIIYNERLFYSYIIDYLKAPQVNEEMKRQLIICFRYYFEEVQKGNMTLKKEYPLTDYEASVAYIWYKWFSDLEWEDVPFVRFYQIERYGIE